MIKPGDEPIPGYRLEALLGRGQFGQVWRARSPGNTTLALKFLELSGKHGWKEFRAIQRVKQIRHAHLMPIVAIWLLDEHGQIISDDLIESIATDRRESGDDSAADTLVVEPIKQTRRPAQLVVATLLANKTLGDRLRECQEEGCRGIPVDELLGYMEEAAKGLDYLNLSEHKIGESLGAVQHCDVKPDNIMLAGGSVVISDFGVAQTLAQARRNATATSLGGTPAYMAPECFANKPCQATDQYSLAVTYYELRTGALPFEEQTYAAVYKAHHEGSLDFSACKPAEQQVLRKATALDPNHRFASCAEFVRELVKAVQPGPKAASGSPRRIWGVATASLAVLAAGAIGFAVFLYPYGDSPRPTANLTIVVDPIDAKVTVDGSPLALDGKGRAIVKREIGQPLTLKASRPPDRDEGSVVIPVRGDGEHRLTLEYSALHFAEEADQRLEDGRFDEAVESLTTAIKKESEAYARLPKPHVCLADGGAVDLLQASTNGCWLAAGLHDGTVRRWAIDAPMKSSGGELMHAHEGAVKGLALSDDWIASIQEDADQILLSGPSRELAELSLPDRVGTLERIIQVAITGRGRWLVASSEELVDPTPPMRWITRLYSWDLEQPDVAASRREIVKLDGQSEPRLAAAHGQAWVALATTDPTFYAVRLCPVEGEQDEKPIYQQSGEVRELVVSPDDRLIACGGGPVSDEADLLGYRVTLINAQTKKWQTMGRAHSDSISSVAFDHEGRFLATGSVDGDAQAWTLPNRWDASTPIDAEPVFLHGVGDEPVTTVACPNAGWVVCNHRRSAVLWECQIGAPKSLAFSKPSGGVTSMTVTPDGRWIITGQGDGTLQFWPVDRLRMLMRACAAAGVELRPTEEPIDQVTHYDRSSQPALGSL